MTNQKQIDPRKEPTKDNGNTKIGGGAIHFGDKPEVKDSGRVHMGGGAIHF